MFLLHKLWQFCKLILLFLFKLYTFVFFFPMLVVSFLFFSSIGILLSFIPKIGERLTVKSISYWAKYLRFTIPMLYKVEGIEKIQKKESYVILANHTSLVDVVVLYSLFGTKIRSVMKKELRSVPVFGYTCERMGNITVDRSDSKRAIASINKAKEKIKNGISIFFFPEGTRNKESGLKPFKKGAFHTALDMNLPILPLTIVGAQKICPNGTLNVRPGVVKVVVHDPIDTSKYSKESMDKLIEKSYNSIASSL